MLRHPDWLPTSVRYGLEHDPGWDQIVRALVDSAGAVTLLQVKEKFGVLRVYAEPDDPGFRERVAAAEQLSARTCERCGEPGSMRTTAEGWMKTLCDRHASEPW